MKNFIKVFLTVLILLVGTNCFALNKANDQYPKLVCDVHGNMHYTIAGGDTLSEIAQHYHKTQASIASASGIVDRNRIYAYAQMIIPCSSVKQSSATVAKSKNVDILPIHKTVIAEISTELTETVSEQPLVELPLAVHDFVATPDNVTVAVAPTQPELTPITPSRSRSSTTPTKKVKGYQLVYTSAEAKAKGIILNRDLPTQVFLYRNDENKKQGLMDGEIHSLRSRAELRGTNVVLSISLTQKPTRPFMILIAGVNQPIDGDYFMASCEPLTGRFPGRRPFTRVMFAGGKMLANATIVTVLSGGNLPLGITVGFGLPIARAALQHHVNTIQRRAEFGLQQTEIAADMPIVVPDPTEFALANPTN